jgi:hypothetical protein
MKKEFIPYEQALELKELGFDEPCLAWHNSGRLFIDSYNAINSKMDFDYCCALPLYQQAFRWFREKSFICHVTNDLSDSCYDEIYVYVMTKGYGDLIDRSEEYRTYEEAELECLKKLIEIAKA